MQHDLGGVAVLEKASLIPTTILSVCTSLLLIKKCIVTCKGPWIMADLEAGLWACENPNSINPAVASMVDTDFVTGLVKGQPGQWGLKAGNATRGGLVKSFEGPRPPKYVVQGCYRVARYITFFCSLFDTPITIAIVWHYIGIRP